MYDLPEVDKAALDAAASGEKTMYVIPFNIVEDKFVSGWTCVTDKKIYTILDGNSRERPKAPGMRYRHYAPRGSMLIVEGAGRRVVEEINRRIEQDKAAGLRTGVLATRENVDLFGADVVKCMGSRENEEEIANSLYRCLREMDDENVERIYSESFSTNGIGQAIMNRLLKAAGHEIMTIEEDASDDSIGK